MFISGLVIFGIALPLAGFHSMRFLNLLVKYQIYSLDYPNMASLNLLQNPFWYPLLLPSNLSRTVFQEESDYDGCALRSLNWTVLAVLSIYHLVL